jgi:signal peptidase I
LSRRRKISLLLLLILGALAIAANFFLRFTVVVGASMEPTLKQWDYCVMLRTRSYTPQRGDVVMFRTANDPPEYLIKRVIGLPGETIAVSNGVITINDEPYRDPLNLSAPSSDMEPRLIGEDRIFVMGDNREGSLHTVVATRLVVARLLWYWRWKKS